MTCDEDAFRHTAQEYRKLDHHRTTDATITTTRKGARMCNSTEMICMKINFECTPTAMAERER